MVQDQDQGVDGSPRAACGDQRLGAPATHPGQGAHVHHAQGRDGLHPVRPQRRDVPDV
jgi:hypothetical protein